MKSARPIITLLILLFFGLAPLSGRAAPLMANPRQVEAYATYGSLPLTFVENQGQVNPGVRYHADGDGYVMFLTNDGLFVAFPELTEIGLVKGTSNGESDKKWSIQPRIVSFQPINPSGPIQVKGENRRDGVSHFYIGNDPAAWKTHVPQYGSVLFRELYPGVDLQFYSTGREMEYDLVLKPGADPNQLAFRYSGVEGVELNVNGDLDVRVREGLVLTQKKPVIYQEIDGARVERSGRFRIDRAVLATAAASSSSALARSSTMEPRLTTHYEAGKTQEVVFGFEVDDYDRTRPLIIDPVIVYTKYLTSSGQDYGLSIATDSTGAAYLAGYTWLGGTSYYARVTKLNAAGNTVVYNTTLGSTDNDSFGNAIALDSSNNAYLAGTTLSTGFPTRTPFQPSKDSQDDAFLTKLGGTGTITYSTYLGGSGRDLARGIAVDADGSAYVAGETNSTDFPTEAPLYGTNAGGYDAFLAKFVPAGNLLTFATYLGGSGNDYARAVALDSSKRPYVVGLTYSNNFPVTTTTTFGGVRDAFVTRFQATGASVVYSRYLGGNSSDSANAVAVDSSGNAYVAGDTDSSNFPTTTGAFQTTIKKLFDAFATKLSTSGTITASTYLGGTGVDAAYGIAVDASGNAYLTGYTTSSDFPVSNAFQSTKDTYNAAIVTKIDSGWATVSYSSYFLGATGDDTAKGIAIDSAGSAYLAGYTSLEGAWSAFAAKIGDTAAIQVTAPNGGESWAQASTQTIRWTYSGLSSTGTVTIDLYKAGVFSRTLMAGVAIGSGGTGSYSWEIPTDVAAGVDYQMMVTSDASPTVSDTSDTYFTITLPPVTADFSGSPLAGKPPLTVAFTNLSAGDVDTASWEFGDGGTSTAWNASHTYTTGGAYDVKLTVSGTAGTGNTTKSAYVRVGTLTLTSPVGGESWPRGTTKTVRWSYTGSPGTVVTVNLLRGSTSTVIVAGTSLGASGVGTYSWAIPDTLEPSGDYKIQVVSTDASVFSSTSTDYFSITGPGPLPDFSATPLAGAPPLTVVFSDLSTGTPTSWLWDFGDGTTSTEQNPSHIYTATGSYSVTLSATNAAGTNRKTVSKFITVANPPVSDFSGTPLTGAPPLTVAFTDKSTGPPTTWLWNFGDGTTSTDQNPSHIYTTDGTYTVRLKVTNAGGSDLKAVAGYVTVVSAPVANFSASPTSGQSPLSVAFTDLSTNTPTSWLWDFGDGTTATEQNPTHVFRLEGTYTVKLTATNAGGSNTKTMTSYITATAKTPEADFSATPVTGIAPLAVTFSDQSTGSVTSWLWNFGDGTTSTARNPSHTYTRPGHYTVTLTVGGIVGGSPVTATKTVSDFITAEGITLTAPNGGETWAIGSTHDITWNYIGDPGSTVRIRLFKANTVVGDIVTNTSSGSGGTGSYAWTIPTNREAGTNYKIRVISRANSSFTDASDANFTIAPAVVAAFHATPLTGTPALTVQFTDDSTGTVTGWNWDFGDGKTSTVRNPSHTYNLSGTYSVTLTATGPSGSSTYTRTNYVTVSAATPTVNFSGTPTTGTYPLTVQFTDLTTGSATGWAWTFGDGGTSTDQNPSYTYTTAGTYSVKLVVTYASGTVTTTKTGYITVTTPSAPVADFTGTPTSGAAPLAVQFTDASTGSITSRSWDFGDGATGTETSPTHTYRLAGTYTVKLTVTGPGGSNTKTRTSYITVPAAAPTADFSGTPTSGDRPLTVNFTDLSTGSVTAWGWSFGDTTTSTTRNPSHTYSHPGSYTVAFGVTGDQGSATITKTAYVSVNGIEVTAPNGGETWQAGSTHNITWSYNGSLGTTVRIQLYKGSSLLQEIATGVSIGSNGTGSYSWAIPLRQTVASDYRIRVSSTSAPSYADLSDATFSITEPSPQADFTGTPVAGVVPLTVSFTNTSVGSGITSYAWTFGDETSSTEQNPAHTYTAPGTYTVSLTITWSGGTHTTTKTNYIIVASGPFLLLTAPNGGESWAAGSTQNITWTYAEDLDSGLPGPTVRIQLMKAGVAISTLATAAPIGSGGLGSFAWTLPNSLTAGSNYRIRITSTASSTYRDLSDSIFTITGVPVADFTASPTSGGIPLTVNFTDASLGNITSWQWDFGDGGTGTGENPSHIYTSAGTYTVTLQVSGPLGDSTKTRTDYITASVVPPTAGFTGNPLTGVKPLTVAFTNTSTGTITSYAWTFGDGGTSTEATPSHTYTTAGSYGVSLKVTGPGGTDTRTISNYITVTEPAPVAAFQGTPTSGSTPLTVNFVDQSTGTITSWAWDFGDGGTSTAQNPSYTYNTPGQYTVKLTATGPTGSDTLTKTNYITATSPPPVAAFSGTPRTGAAPLSVTFTDASTGGPVTSWLWDFGDSTTSTLQNPTHSYTTPGSYTVTLTATGPGGSNSHVESAYIKVPPAAAFSGDPLSGKAPLNVTFTDASTGTNTAWAWTFGDGGTSTLQNPTHSYTTPGLYSVSLTTTGPGGSNTITKTSYVAVAPTADFSGDTLSGPLPLTVNFTDSSTGTNTSWAWTFGDGGTSTLRNPSHTYTATGTYNVTLMVTGAGGSDTKTITGYIKVTPRAAFSASPTQVAKGQAVTFTNSSTGTGITSCLWDFGDGATQTTTDTSAVTHAYSTAGVYTVSLTVTGAAGSHTTTQTNYITVGQIVVTAPNGGEDWYIGQTKTITWTYQNVPGTQVIVRLSSATYGSQDLVTQSIGTGGNGSFSWTLPTSLTPGIDYRIRVFSTSDSTYTDLSDSTFSILQSTVTLTSPNSSSVSWTEGSTQSITWIYAGQPANLKIDLYKSDVFLQNIVASTSVGSGGTGSYSWAIPTDLAGATDYKVKITTVDGLVSDMSDNPFTIVSTVTVVSPNLSTDHWLRTESVTIQWTYTGNSSALVKIELLKSGTSVSTISSSTAISAGSLAWTVPSSLAIGSDYAIRITNVSFAQQTDTSDNTFRINTIRVTSPNGGESWKRGTSKTITWDFGATSGTVNIYLYRGTTSTLLKSGATGSNGSWTWNISSGTAVRSDYTIRVTSSTDSTNYDVSDATFRITN